MIIAKMHDQDGEVAVLVGLSKGNMDELLKGHPIYKPMAETGLPVSIIVVGGETEEAIMGELKKNFTIPDEVVEDRTRGG